MKAYIFDLDGTIIDSYSGILDSLECLMKKNNIDYKREEIYTYIMKLSVHDFLNEISLRHTIPLEVLSKQYSDYRVETMNQVKLMPNAKEAIEALYQDNLLFIYTHKGSSTYSILSNFSILDYFTEVITSESGFLRKPNPEAIYYLMDKYRIAKENAYYIGDRPIDVECAKNAGIIPILYKPIGSPIEMDSITVYDLLDIKNKTEA